MDASLHLTFFGEERAPDGSTFFDVARVILRGTTLLAARGFIPLAPVGLADIATGAGADALAEARDGLALVRGVNSIMASDASQLRAWDARIDRLERDGALTVVSREADTVLRGRVHERLQQSIDGIPILGADLARQTRDGATVSLFGQLHLGIEVDTVPTVSRESAREQIAAQARARLTATTDPRLVVRPLEAGGYALAWHAEARTTTDVRTCDVDAHTGRVLRDDSILKSQGAASARGKGESGDTRPLAVSEAGGRYVAVDRRRAATVTTFDLRGDAGRTGSVVEGTSTLTADDVASSPTVEWKDAAVVDAHANAGAAQAFFADRFGRRGYDGLDGALAVVAHPAGLPATEGSSEDARFRTGAFWDGRRIILGDGTASLDTVAHEFAHAVAGASARFASTGDAAALEEAFADIMAEAAAVDAGTTRAAPAGTSRVYRLAVDAAGAGRRLDIERALFRAFVYLMPSSATLSSARAASLQSARDLLGDGSAVERALEQAWTAAGVR